MRRVLIISAAAHLALLALLPVIPNLGVRQPLAMEVYAVELVDVPREAPPSRAPTPEPEPETPKTEPVVERVEEDPIPEQPARLRKRAVKPPPPKRREKSLEEKIAERLKAEERERPREEAPEESPTPPPSGTTTISAGKVADYYLTMLQGKITRNWKQTSARFAAGKALTARVSFTVLSDGSITNLRLARSSGWTTVDQSALQAVRASAPFAGLPPTYSGDRLDVTIDFTVTQ